MEPIDHDVRRETIFAVSDYVAGALTGAATAAAVRAVVRPDLDMVLAMLVGMAAGMLAHLAIDVMQHPPHELEHAVVVGAVFGRGWSDPTSSGGQVHRAPHTPPATGARGLITSFIMELLVYPAIYFVWRGWSLPRGERTAPLQRGLP